VKLFGADWRYWSWSGDSTSMLMAKTDAEPGEQPGIYRLNIVDGKWTLIAMFNGLRVSSDWFENLLSITPDGRAGKSILCGGISSSFSGQQLVITISKKFPLRSSSASQALERTGCHWPDRRQPGDGPETGFEEINSNVRQADFWPGTTPR
jgi:hypothetical protein